MTVFWTSFSLLHLLKVFFKTGKKLVNGGINPAEKTFYNFRIYRMLYVLFCPFDSRILKKIFRSKRYKISAKSTSLAQTSKARNQIMKPKKDKQ